jgi:hypothetical protein
LGKEKIYKEEDTMIGPHKDTRPSFEVEDERERSPGGKLAFSIIKGGAINLDRHAWTNPHRLIVEYAGAAAPIDRSQQPTAKTRLGRM